MFRSSPPLYNRIFYRASYIPFVAKPCHRHNYVVKVVMRKRKLVVCMYSDKYMAVLELLYVILARKEATELGAEMIVININ